MTIEKLNEGKTIVLHMEFDKKKLLMMTAAFDTFIGNMRDIGLYDHILKMADTDQFDRPHEKIIICDTCEVGERLESYMNEAEKIFDNYIENWR